MYNTHNVEKLLTQLGLKIGICVFSFLEIRKYWLYWFLIKTGFNNYLTMFTIKLINTVDCALKGETHLLLFSPLN